MQPEYLGRNEEGAKAEGDGESPTWQESGDPANESVEEHGVE